MEYAIQLPLQPWADKESSYRDGVNSYALYPTDNALDIPIILREGWVPDRLVAFNDPKGYGSDAAVHFFVHDYRFERLWRNPSKYFERLDECGAVITPDFSTYVGMPLAMQLWQTYRSRWIGAHLQAHGFTVIPSVSWAEPADFYFMGLPRNGVLAVSTNGVNKSEEVRDYFRVGWEKLVELEPECVLVLGSLEDIVDYPGVEVREYPDFIGRRLRSIEEPERPVRQEPDIEPLFGGSN